MIVMSVYVCGIFNKLTFLVLISSRWNILVDLINFFYHILLYKLRLMFVYTWNFIWNGRSAILRLDIKLNYLVQTLFEIHQENYFTNPT